MEHTGNQNFLQKQILYVLKALAIISAAAAHCVGYNIPQAEKLNALLGTVGVPVFFILSGFFFKVHSQEFWGKKWKSIVIPWLVWGAITSCVSCFANGKMPSIPAMISWTLGCSTWLYFVPVLLVCFALFRVCSTALWACSLIGIWLISNGLTIVGALNGIGPFTQYQNVLNWVGFFSIGFLLQGAKFEHLLVFLDYHRVGIVLLTVTIALVITCLYEPSYWTPLSIVFELLSGATLLQISKYLWKSKLLVNIGMNTFPIFFAHMQFGVSILNRLIFDRVLLHARVFEYILILLRPITVVFFTYSLIVLGSMFVKKLGLGQWLWVLGIERLK